MHIFILKAFVRTLSVVIPIFFLRFALGFVSTSENVIARVFLMLLVLILTILMSLAINWLANRIKYD